MLEISFVAKLSDDVAIIGSAEDIVTLEHIGVVELFESINLSL
jgi:hypothetical protein